MGLINQLIGGPPCIVSSPTRGALRCRSWSVLAPSLVFPKKFGFRKQNLQSKFAPEKSRTGFPSDALAPSHACSEVGI